MFRGKSAKQTCLGIELLNLCITNVHWCADVFFICVMTRIFLRHTADVRSDSGCPTPCDRCDTLHYRTPRTQLGRVSRCFPFCYDSNISLIYCGHPVGLRMSDSAQWPRHFCIIGQLAPNSAECSDVFPFITFHLSFFQVYFHCCLAYPISDISRGTCI